MKEQIKAMKVNGFYKQDKPSNVFTQAQDNPFPSNEQAKVMGETPLRKDAFDLSDEEKMKLIEEKFRDVLTIMGLDLNDDSLKETPHRVAKMYIQELFRGLNPANMPRISVFENNYHYGEMLVERDITVHSTCEHHLLPITGVAHVAYIARDKVIGLSKLNRIVDYFARRPQVQERLTVRIAEELQKLLGTPDVAVIIDAHHHCVSARGIKDQKSTTITAQYCGAFKQVDKKQEFLAYLK